MVLGIDPYKTGMLKKSPYVKKTTVDAVVVAVLDFAAENRGLQLIAQPSRAVIKGNVHELMITNDTEAAPDRTVDPVSYLAFVCVENSGVLLRNDNVYLNEVKIGKLAGFDETHMPNHQNIVIQSDQRFTGLEKGIELGDIFRFAMDSGE
jgi:hypothetical protein